MKDNSKLPEKIQKALDEVFYLYTNNENIIFEIKSLNKKYKFLSIKNTKTWSKSKKCMIEGCDNRSIKKSHTIQKSASIDIIAEKGHLLSPFYNEVDDTFEMKKIGVNNASTFPGFCTTHESLFSPYEIIKDIKSANHLVLQLYRTVCREKFHLKKKIVSLKNDKEQYINLRNDRLLLLLKEKLIKDYENFDELGLKISKINTDDDVIRSINDAIKKYKRDMSFLNAYIYNIYKDFNQEKINNIAYGFIEMPVQVPVAMSGFSNFRLKLNNKIGRQTSFIFNVIPFENRTYVYMSSLKSYQSEIDMYMSNRDYGLNLINMIEQWMIVCTDHWFIKPSTWNKISDERKTKILEAMHSKIVYPNGNQLVSIFNGIREIIIDSIESNGKIYDAKILEYLKKEKSKLLE